MRKQGGFTLVEVMVTLVLFAGTMAAFAGVYAATARLRESSRNLTQAMNDGRIVLEGIRDTSTGGGLAAVTGTDWTAWAPANGLVNPVTGQTWLENEVVRVFYIASPPPPPAVPGPPPAGPPDPLTITVRIEWTERNRVRWADVSTLMTRR